MDQLLWPVALSAAELLRARAGAAAGAQHVASRVDVPDVQIIHLLGAAGTVTGSRYLVSTAGRCSWRGLPRLSDLLGERVRRAKPAS